MIFSRRPSAKAHLCESCGREIEIGDWPRCPHGHGAGVRIGDEIPGGIVLENYGPDPVRVYSHSERKALMKARGLEEMVRHVGVPGTDKSPHTTDLHAGCVTAEMLENARVLVSRSAEPRTVRTDRDDELAAQSFRDDRIAEFNLTATLPAHSGA